MNDNKFTDKCIYCYYKTWDYLFYIVPPHAQRDYDWYGHFEEEYPKNHKIHMINGIE